MPKVERDGLRDAPPMPHLGRDAPPGAWPRFSDAPGGARVRASEAPPRPQWVPCAGHWTHHIEASRPLRVALRAQRFDSGIHNSIQYSSMNSGLSWYSYL